MSNFVRRFLPPKRYRWPLDDFDRAQPYPHFPEVELCYPSKRFKLCFIHMPKNSSSTMKEFLELPGERILYRDKPAAYKDIVVLRNPLRRIVSIFSEVLKLREDTPFKITERSAFYQAYVDGDLMESFDGFLDVLAETNFYEPHSWPQSWFLERKGISLSDIDYVLLSEELGQGIDALKKEFSRPFPELTHSNRGKRLQELKDQLESFRPKIEKLYAEDLELYRQAEKLCFHRRS